MEKETNLYLSINISMKVLRKEQSIDTEVPLKVEACGWEINNFILFSHSFPASLGPLLFSLHMTNEIGQIEFSFFLVFNKSDRSSLPFFSFPKRCTSLFHLTTFQLGSMKIISLWSNRFGFKILWTS